MSDPNTGGVGRDPDKTASDPIERSFDPAGEREPGVPADDDAHSREARLASGRWRTGPASAGEAAERSVDVGGSPGAVPDDLRREPGHGGTKAD